MIVRDKGASAREREAQQAEAARQREQAARLLEVWLPLIVALAQIDEVDAVRGHLLWTMMSDVDIRRGRVPRVADSHMRRLVAGLPAYYARRFERAAGDPEVQALTVLADAVS